MHKVLIALLLLISGFAQAQPVVSNAGVKFMVRWEVGGPDVYVKRYQMPIWPGNALSGATVGIGYDLGHNSVDQIMRDWFKHPERAYLAAMSGIKGEAAGRLVKRREWIQTPLPLAMEVFLDPTLIRYYNITRRSFPGMETMPQPVQDMLVDLVYNRGGNMVGDGRREMRHIRDVCIPDRDSNCVSAQLRAMSRIWEGSKLGKGLIARRNQEADFIRIRT